MVVTIRYT